MKEMERRKPSPQLLGQTSVWHCSWPRVTDGPSQDRNGGEDNVLYLGISNLGNSSASSVYLKAEHMCVLDQTILFLSLPTLNYDNT